MRSPIAILLSIFITIIYANVVPPPPLAELVCKKGKSDSSECTTSTLTIDVTDTSLADIDEKDFTILHILNAAVKFLPINLRDSFSLIRTLRVFNSSLTEIKKANFDGLDGITELNFVSNELTRLDENTFQGLPKLEKIFLDQNLLKLLPSKIFAANKELTIISVKENQLKHLQDTTFKGLTNLKRLLISHNAIEDFNSGTFDSCKKLEIINFSHNKLKHTPDDIFKSVVSTLKFDRKYFVNNDCIDAYEASHGVVSSFEFLKKAFGEYCKPSNQALIDELRSEIEKLQKNVKNLEKSVEEGKKELKKVTQEKEECEENFKTCDDENKDLKEKATTYDDEKSTLDKEINDKNEEIEKLTKENSNFAKENESLKTQLTDFTSTNAILKKANEGLQTSVLSCAENRGTCANDLKAEKEKCEKITEDFQSLQMTASAADESKNKIEDLLKICKGEVEENKLTLDIFKRLIRENKDATCSNEVNRNALELATYDIPCTFGKLEVKNFPSHYSCTVENFVNLKCNAKFNQLTGSHKRFYYDSSVEALNVEDTSLIELPLAVFEKFPNLKTLRVVGGVFGTFNYKCGKIESFSILKSRVGEEFGVIECNYLKKLNFDNANLRVIKAAAKVPTLTEMILRNNKIEEVSVEFFKNFENLETLDLTRNKLSQLDGKIFDFNPKLHTVVFTDNQITRISEAIFTKNSMLQHLVFKNCGCVDKVGTGLKVNDVKAEINEKCK